MSGLTATTKCRSQRIMVVQPYRVGFVAIFTASQAQIGFVSTLWSYRRHSNKLHLYLPGSCPGGVWLLLDHQVSHLRVSAGVFAHPRRAICRASVCRSPSGLANLVHSPILSLLH